MCYQEGNHRTVLAEIGQFLCQTSCIYNLSDIWRTPFKVWTTVGRYRCRWLAGTAPGKYDFCKEHLPAGRALHSSVQLCRWHVPSAAGWHTAGIRNGSALGFLTLSFSNTVDTGRVNHKTGVSVYLHAVAHGYSWVRTLLCWFTFNLWLVTYACLCLESVLCHSTWERLLNDRSQDIWHIQKFLYVSKAWTREVLWMKRKS